LTLGVSKKLGVENHSREFASQIPTAGFSEKSRERLVKGVKKTACLSVASLQFLAFCV